jgi:hypothetical protein
VLYLKVKKLTPSMAGVEFLRDRAPFRTLAESLGVAAQHPRVRLTCQLPPSFEDVGQVDAR